MLSFSSSPCVYYSGYHYGLITIAGSLSLRLLSNWYSCVYLKPPLHSFYVHLSMLQYRYDYFSHHLISQTLHPLIDDTYTFHLYTIISPTPSPLLSVMHTLPFLFMTLMPLSFICHSSYFFLLLTLIWGQKELIKGFLSSFVFSGIVH